MQKLLTLFCVLASLLPAAPALAAMPDAEFLKLCEQGSPAAVAQALKDGANPNAADKDGETALLKAAYYSQAGAAVNAADTQGKTALMYAASKGNTQVVRLLLEAGADVNFANRRGETALLEAACYGRAGAIRALLQAGADVNARDKDGKTPLLMAAYWSSQLNLRESMDPDCVPALLQAGADANAVDEQGRTARVLAEYAAFQGWLLDEKNPAAGWPKLLRDRESPQTRGQHWRRAAALWSKLLGLLSVGLVPTIAGLCLPLWAFLGALRLRGWPRRLLFLTLMTGAAFVLLWGALDFVWSDDDPHLEKALSLSAGMLRFPVQQLVLVNAILLFVRFLRWRRPPAGPSGPKAA